MYKKIPKTFLSKKPNLEASYYLTLKYTTKMELSKQESIMIKTDTQTNGTEVNPGIYV